LNTMRPDLGRVVVDDGTLEAADPERAHGRLLILAVSEALFTCRMRSLCAILASPRTEQLCTGMPRIAAMSDGRRRRRSPSTSP